MVTGLTSLSSELESFGQFQPNLSQGSKSQTQKCVPLSFVKAYKGETAKLMLISTLPKERNLTLLILLITSILTGQSL